jgi:hypothetical protein
LILANKNQPKEKLKSNPHSLTLVFAKDIHKYIPQNYAYILLASLKIHSRLGMQTKTFLRLVEDSSYCHFSLSHLSLSLSPALSSLSLSLSLSLVLFLISCSIPQCIQLGVERKRSKKTKQNKKNRKR